MSTPQTLAAWLIIAGSPLEVRPAPLPSPVPGEIVVKHDVSIIGHLNVPSRVPVDASNLFAKNLVNFIEPHVDAENGTLNFDFDDETVSGTCLSRDGKLVHPQFGGPQPAPEPEPEADAATEGDS